MMAPVFVDVSLLVCWRDSTEPAKQARAAEWLDKLWRERRGRTSTQVLAEYYVTVTRKLQMRMAAEEAWRDVQALGSWGPQPIDMELLKRAQEIELEHRLGWWESQVVAAAQVQGCTQLLTDALQNRANFDGVIARNPFELEVADEHAAHAAVPRVSARYRGRGRPRTKPRSAIG